ncbi:DUF2313 domain-containing protein [Roseomonas frigidaquae]|uniref:DUF2313 domain-containing protein n=1 Tax=Falsiroseomonas frigidaquae TaxID=487318 RepID=A0ABX1ESJ3_9PROT|nr:putative phage tail protein [Falsiroseomonas frigidaquae]NKE43589.1 DUF2313 domain-containing protein [Falsiroseomonas frigidaquae]
MADSDRTEAELLAAAQALMPTGPVWPRETGATQTRILAGVAATAARLRARARALLDDAFPASAFYLLPEWEEALGLPDACSGAAPTLQGRRDQVVARLTARGGQSRAYFIGVAAALGFPVTIREFAPFRIGGSVVGAPLLGDDWAFAWEISAPEQVIRAFELGTSVVGEPLRSWGNGALECVLRRLAPAHTILIFAYRVETVLAPAQLIAPLALTRAQPGSRSAALGADGVIWQEFPADAPRFHGTSRRLLREGSKTNIIADARTAFGAGWSNTGIAAVVSAVGPDGVAGQGALVTESTTTSNHRSQHNTSVTAEIGVSYTLHWLVRAGTCTNVQLCFSLSHGSTGYQNFGLTGDGVVGTGGSGVSRATIRRIGDWYLCRMTATATAAAIVSAILMMGNLLANGRLASFPGTGRTLTSGWAWLTEGVAATSPILPAIGAPEVSAREADILTVNLRASLEIEGPFTVLWRGLLAAGAMDGADQVLLQVDAGTFDDFIRIRHVSGTGLLRTSRTAAGVSASASDLGPVAGDSLFSLGLSLDADGRMTVSLDGGAVVAVTGVATDVLAILRLGCTLTDFGAMSGQIEKVRVLPYASADGDLPALVAALSA